MKTDRTILKKYALLVFFMLLFLIPINMLSQSRLVGGMITIDKLNRPGVGGILISVKGSELNTVSDNDGEYRIQVENDKAILVFSYPGMQISETEVGSRKRIDVDLVKFPEEKPLTVEADTIGIVIDEKSNEIIHNVAVVLKSRLQKNSKVEVTIGNDFNNKADLHIYLGKLSASERLKKLCTENNLKLPGIEKAFAEGYAVKMIGNNSKPIIIAVGADNRGVLYAAGEILRQMQAEATSIRFKTFDIRTSPAYRFRGTNEPQGGTMQKITKSRDWTMEERKEALLDYALAGANIFAGESWNGTGERYDFIKSFDLMTLEGIRPNQFQGELPEEWKSGGLAEWEWHGSNWVCPSIPEARKALLKQWEEKLKTFGDHDILRFYGGDPGGCRDDRCKPWGKTFVELCKDISKMALKTHPDLVIMIANQDMTNEGDMAIFDYLSAKPQDWLYGLAYGPGSNAMSWYFRHSLRNDLFAYQGYGWLNRYLAEILNSLPKDQKIVHYSDVTHWIMAQYNIENPERNMVRAYGRRTWHTRPADLYKIFQAIMPFSEGDMTYSEGYHDQFNQYLWQRLLWNPQMSAQDVVKEYCSLYFGEEAVGPMTQAIFQLEKNLVEPLATNKGIDRYYSLVKEGGSLIPENRMETDHLWRLFMQRASLDKYNQLKLQRELSQEERIRSLLKPALTSGKFKKPIEQSLLILTEERETPEMIRFREEAGRLGEESEKLFGFRNIGFYKLDRHLRDMDKLSKALKKAKKSRSKKEQRELVNKAIETTLKKTAYGNYR